MILEPRRELKTISRQFSPKEIADTPLEPKPTKRYTGKVIPTKVATGEAGLVFGKVPLRKSLK